MANDKPKKPKKRQLDSAQQKPKIPPDNQITHSESFSQPVIKSPRLQRK